MAKYLQNIEEYNQLLQRLYTRVNTLLCTNPNNEGDYFFGDSTAQAEITNCFTIKQHTVLRKLWNSIHDLLP